MGNQSKYHYFRDFLGYLIVGTIMLFYKDTWLFNVSAWINFVIGILGVSLIIIIALLKEEH